MFVPVIHFRPGLVFSGKVGAYPSGRKTFFLNWFPQSFLKHFLVCLNFRNRSSVDSSCKGIFWRQNIHYNDTFHYDVMLNIVEHVLGVTIIRAIILNVITLSIIGLSAIILNVTVPMTFYLMPKCRVPSD